MAQYALLLAPDGYGGASPLLFHSTLTNMGLAVMSDSDMRLSCV
jgi:hypothetical protein